MSSPIKTMLPLLPVAAGCIALNAAAKTINMCTESGLIIFRTVPASINIFLPGNSCSSASVAAGVWIAATALASYAIYKSEPKPQQPQPLIVVENEQPEPTHRYFLRSRTV